MELHFSLHYGGREHTDSTLPRCGEGYLLEDGVTVTPEITRYDDFGAVEWLLRFRNGTDHDSAVLSDIADCDITVPVDFSRTRRGFRTDRDEPHLLTMHGMIEGAEYACSDADSAAEFTQQKIYLFPGEARHFVNTTGRSSDSMMPFFDLSAYGEGLAVAIGWTGSWQALFDCGSDSVRIRTGLVGESFYLLPGEEVRTTRVLLMPYAKGQSRSDRFRALLRTHLSPRAMGRREGLLAYELWGGLPGEEMCRRLGELKAHDVRFEDVWIDAGWYGDCTDCTDCYTGDWGKFTGDWSVNRRVHPDLLHDTDAAAQDAGMRLMLWLEPERIVSGLPVSQQHPEWLLRISAPQDPAMTHLMVDLGNEEAWNYVHDTIAHYVRDLHLGCYRQDFNICPADYFAEHDAPGRRGITEIRHITGMYRLWDALLEEFPDLLIDNCSSGGRRIDIETLRRAIPFFRSDFQCGFNAEPEVLQVHGSGIHDWLPYNGCTTKVKGDTYTARSSYSSSWGVGFYNAIFQSMDEADFAWARQTVEEYRRIRRWLSQDFTCHGSRDRDPTGWTVWQFHDAADGSGIVMAFRRSASPFDSFPLTLRGADADAKCRFTCLDTGESFTGTAALTVTLPQKRSSVIWEYRVL